MNRHRTGEGIAKTRRGKNFYSNERGRTKATRNDLLLKFARADGRIRIAHSFVAIRFVPRDRGFILSFVCEFYPRGNYAHLRRERVPRRRARKRRTLRPSRTWSAKRIERYTFRKSVRSVRITSAGGRVFIARDHRTETSGTGSEKRKGKRVAR